LKTFAEQLLFPNVVIDKKRLQRKISGKTIVITGASYGIGEQLALLFSTYDVHLILIARTTQRLKLLASIIEENGSRCSYIIANLYKENEVSLVIEELQKFTNIDIFISNAGKSITRPLTESLNRYHDFTRTNSLNYLAPVKMLLAATPMIACSNGHIVNVSAMNVLLLPAPKWAAYQASKTAFDQWFRSNLAEWRIMGIQAKTIYLPLVRTGMIASNKNYAHYPAMQPQQAAIRIAALICSSDNRSKPWWAIFAQAGTFVGRTIWERHSYNHLKRK